MSMMVVPAANFYTFKNTFHVTKHHKFTNSGIKLSLTEMFESGYAYDTHQINYKKITLEEWEPEPIIVEFEPDPELGLDLEDGEVIEFELEPLKH